MNRIQEGTFPDGELDDAAEIGAVSDRVARIWVRRPGSDRVPVRLEVEGRDPVLGSVAVSAESDWTGAAELTLPDAAPDRPFTVTVNGRVLSGRFAPAAAAHLDFTFGFGSCHHPFALGPDGRLKLNDAAGIYPEMREELTAADARFLLLIGDQIYSDEIPSISIRDHLPGDEQHPPPLEIAVQAYRRITRGYLGEAGFRRVRETFPTLWMWDDHDIFNDWGSLLHESPLDKLLFAAANRVYREYQQRHDPTNLTDGDGPPYTFFYRFGTAGFLVLDLRGARNYEEGTLLGRKQWAIVQSFLQSEEAETLHTLFVVASVPVAHFSRWLVEAFQWLPTRLANDVRDRWSSRAFIDSRDALMDELFRWQTATPYRQAIVLSGDVHAASAFTVRDRRGAGVVRQFTSSAFTTPCIGLVRHLNRFATRASNLFEPRLRFQRHFVTLENNFGRVRLQALPSGGHRVEFAVRAWHPERQQLVHGGRVDVSPDRTHAADSGTFEV
jgi:phosphodiesterase/alkaline phosphatase D-like protein